MVMCGVGWGGVVGAKLYVHVWGWGGKDEMVMWGGGGG